MSSCEDEPVFSAKELESIQKDFERLSSTIYLDHTGAALYPESVVRRVSEDLLTHCYANPHSGSVTSLNTSKAVDQVRLRLLQHFNADPSEYSVVFTSGATASLKLVAETFNFHATPEVKDGNEWYPVPEKRGSVGTLAYYEECHTSVLGMRSLAEERDADVVCLTREEVFSTFDSDKSASASNETSCPHETNSLFVYPAQCNFSGYKYPLEWIAKVQSGYLSHLSSQGSGKWYCFLDAATYLSTNMLDLSRWKPDFVSMSMYKVFGYPTGLGALIIRNSSSDVLIKRYYGGGTVFVALSSKNKFVPRNSISDRFEDGTLDFLSIVSLNYGLDWIRNLDIEKIGRHVHALAAQTVAAMKRLKHADGTPVVRFYVDSESLTYELQGGIINFNVLEPTGSVVGFAKVMDMANLHNIHLRTGCFCNPGACRRHLGLTEENVLHHFKSGHVCGDDNDVIDGQPTGSVRISFGPYSTSAHKDALIDMLALCFVSSTKPWTKPTLPTICNKIIGRLDEIALYPVKSCGKFSVTSWLLDSRGLMYDRMWMICDSNGVALTQKKEPRLCFIKPVIDLEQRYLHLTITGSNEKCSVPLEANGVNVGRSLCRESKVCEDAVTGVDCGDSISRWLQQVLGIPGLRLLRLGVRKDHTRLSLANQGQFLLVNQSSLDWLKERSDTAAPGGNFADRFRANFVISDAGNPFSELLWPAITIGDVIFSVDSGCRRCEMICIDQKTAERGKEPLRSLVRERGKLQFGIYLSRPADVVQTISLADPVIPQPLC